MINTNTVIFCGGRREIETGSTIGLPFLFLEFLVILFINYEHQMQDWVSEH